MASMNNGEAPAAAPNMINPMLLASALVGSWEALDVLFKREDSQDPAIMIPTEEFLALLATASRRIGLPAAPDVELLIDNQPVPLAGVLLQGVTRDGDTALHAAASKGDGQDFLKYATMVCGRSRGLLYVKNQNGDTPLYCAIGAGNLKMVSHLIDQARHEAAPINMNPLLLSSARVGSWEALDVLFQREDAQDTPMMIPTDEFLGLLEIASRRVAVPAARDLELGIYHYHQPAALVSAALLHGVTPDGDTTLHAVASNGDGKDFLKYACMIYGRNRDLLLAKNNNGDTPLHCAARARNSNMVSHLIDLAGREGPNWKLALLRMENKLNETALHEAVRSEYGRILDPNVVAPEQSNIVLEEKNVVKLLMGADPELANHPAEGISPLYLAILLGKSTIALTLYGKSGGNLSYSGADGQNALHLAALRDTDTGNSP
uniref:Uncharacterized protein n=1 Tax=Avena sativa TaxID=4498 RepID=A0ACD5Y6K9_AVESA